jgi:hypothetical protein
MLNIHVILLSHLDADRRSGLFPAALLDCKVDRPNTVSFAMSKYYIIVLILQLLTVL